MPSHSEQSPLCEGLRPSNQLFYNCIVNRQMFLLLLDFLGFYGPILLIILNIFAMWGRWYYILCFILGVGLDNVLNHILKNMICEPRPEKCIPTVFDPCTGQRATVPYRLQQLSPKQASLAGDFGSKPDYGMPSGHAESAVYCWTFLWLMYPKLSWYTGIGAFLVMMTLLQRHVYRRHSIEQLFVGSFLGSVTAVGTYSLITTLHR